MRRATCVAILLCASSLACGGDGDDAVVVFDGQSLNRIPVPDYPALAMAGIRGARAENIAVNGESWTVLAKDVQTRRDPLADGYAVLVMVGGTSDVTSGDDGPTMYGDMASYAESARDAGFDYIIAATIQPSTGATPAEDAARAEANRLLLADAEDAFDEVVDLAGTPGLDDPRGPAYYDGIGHPSPRGAQLMADAIRPAIKQALEDQDQLFG
jgi:hypothetical protein